MNNKSAISFGDNVIVRSTPLTQNLGLAGLTGQVFGETTPSSANVEVIGENQEDYAINVFFEDINEGFWFSSGLLKLVNHGEGTEITLDSVAKKWIKTAKGDWVESDTEDSQRSNKPWWNFW